MALITVLLNVGMVGAQTATHGKIKSVALVIGNGAYTEAGRLKNPVNDATAVDTALRDLGFQTVLATDRSGAALRHDLESFYNQISDASVILFYFAGHGLQVNGENFLAPIDLGARKAPPLMAQLHSVNEVISEIETRARPGASKIVILDACRDNPFSNLLHGSGQRTGRGFARMELPQATASGATTEGYFRIIAFATGPNTTAADGEGVHSPYTRSLIKHIRQPGIEVKDMFVRIAGDVQRDTRGRQRPDFLVQTSKSLYLSIPNITECDRLAIEGQNFVGIPGVPFDDVDPGKAIPACEAALRSRPDSARLNNNLARAYEKSERLIDAFSHYKRAADAGYPPAMNALGIMYLAGCGLPAADVENGVRTIARARELGNLSAEATLTSHDLLPYVSEPGLLKLKRRLGAAAAADVTAALEAYQKQRHLRKAGLTLETIHALGLYEIVPEGFRCH